MTLTTSHIIQVMEGSGKMIVVAVGCNSQAGIIKALILTGKFSTTGANTSEADGEK